jgi:hypothetical protein
MIYDLTGVKVVNITHDDPGALADLAWYELVSRAEKDLPILVIDDKGVVEVR